MKIKILREVIIADVGVVLPGVTITIPDDQACRLIGNGLAEPYDPNICYATTMKKRGKERTESKQKRKPEGR